jgi:hypothetical protein
MILQNDIEMLTLHFQSSSRIQLSRSSNHSHETSIAQTFSHIFLLIAYSRQKLHDDKPPHETPQTHQKLHPISTQLTTSYFIETPQAPSPATSWHSSATRVPFPHPPTTTFFSKRRNPSSFVHAFRTYLTSFAICRIGVEHENPIVIDYAI